jgi:tagaturonate epimerase
VSARLAELSLDLVAASRVEGGGAEWALAREKSGLRLVVAVPPGSRVLDDFEGETKGSPKGSVLVGPVSPKNAAGLRRHLEWLRPRPLGTRTSAGLGDRLGLATPGHVRAVRAVGGFDAIAPIFPQQSIREMTRTGRTPLEVMDDATWGMFAEGWTDGTGADADHLKTTADIDACLAVGFSMFTIDPGEQVDSSADTADLAALRARVAGLPWAGLSDTEDSMRRRYLGRSTVVEHVTIAFDEATLLRAAVKYGRAVAHVAAMARHLRKATGPRLVELEVSVDETETPTSPAEHYWVANELNRLEVAWVSLAPRFVGRFEKGVDYIGDLGALEKDVAAHAALARHFGPYKLSLHSGSDKFSVYPIAARLAKGLVHLKTAGTSYLEALRTVAAVDPAFFRDVYAFARERYDTDKASYHVSAELRKAPLAADVPEKDLPGLLEQFDAREILHVTFGSVLKEAAPGGKLRFKDTLFALLRSNPEAYARNLETHFVKHLKPFAGVGS